MSAAQLVQRFTVSIDKWGRYERRAVPQANAVIVVIEEARERLLRLGVTQERIQVVANYTPLADLATPCNKPYEYVADEKFKVVYAGGFAATRDLYTVIDAVALLSQTETPGLQVVLIGGTGAALESLRRYTNKKQIQDRVVLIDWRPMEEVMEHIKSSRVCLVSHVKSPHTDATIPHKLFQYMACRRPVIVSDCTPLKRIVEETDCGLVYPSGDVSALAICLKRLYDDPQMCNRMGNAGYNAVQDKYNWERTGQTLLRLYRQLESV
jgi:glycosyltransferase involved in cell wall biosynthesis